MELKRISGRILPLVGVFFILILVSIGFFTYKPSEATGLNQGCLQCHSVKGREPKILKDGEKMYLYVNPVEFKKSVHGKFVCIVCHRDINVRTHPRPVNIASKKAYMDKVSKQCLVCHPAKKLSPFHKNILKYSKISCAECHGSHYIKSKEAIREQTLACLQCHSVKGREPKILENGDKMYLYVNKNKFLKSPHAEVGCLACHRDINPKHHPYPRPIKSLKAYTRQINKNCLICHPIESLSKHPGHAMVVRSGMLCTTCHTYHEGKHISAWKKEIGTEHYCLTCHRYAFKKRLPDGEVLNVKVSLAELKHSVHKNFNCIVCHRDFSKDKHPVYRFKSKKEYMAYFSRKVCESCHTEAQLKKNPAHYALTKTASCIECHGYHGVQPVAQVKNLSENAYCLTCHSRDIKKTFADGEEVSLKVDSVALMHSVHKDFKCSQCHTGYSKTSHPIYNYKSLADFRKAGNEICGKCHTGELKKYHNSIHYAKRVSGNTSAPDCLSCHGYHNVRHILGNKELSKEICSRCHKAEGAAFKESVHAKSLTCASCHDAHAVKAVAIANLDKSCLKCHKNLESVHAEWLYNPPFQEETFVKMHFKKCSCAACHAKAEKQLVLNVVDKGTGKPYHLTKAFIEKFDLNKNGKLEQKELWNLMAALKKEENVTLDGKIDVLDKNAAHKIMSKNFALKDCAGCHSPSANFKVSLKGEIPVERAAINSFNIIPNMRDFYAIGLTKVKALDIVFVLAVLAGLGFAFGHIGLRIITTPIRRKRREGK